jgi:hypothetical protein
MDLDPDSIKAPSAVEAPQVVRLRVDRVFLDDIGKGPLRDFRDRNRLRWREAVRGQKPFPTARVARFVRMTGVERCAISETDTG